MFRRFMIVCWIAFSIAVIAAGIGSYLIVHNQTAASSLATDWAIPDDAERFFELNLRNFMKVFKGRG